MEEKKKLKLKSEPDKEEYIYKRDCNQCGIYYEGRGKYFCSQKCHGIFKRGNFVSKETRQKLRINALNQFKNGMPDSTKIKLSKINLGKKLKKETKKKIGERSISSWIKRKKNGWVSPLRDIPRTDDIKKKISRSKIGHLVSVETREKLRKKLKNRIISPETRKKTSETMKKDGIQSERIKNLWKNPEYRKKVTQKFNDHKVERIRKLHSHRKGFSRPEIIMANLLNKYDIPFSYTGDGMMWFKNFNGTMFNPDFVSIKDKSIIEVFGDYWHRNTQAKDQERIEVYKRKGYNTLVVWEHELKSNKFGEGIPEQEILGKINLLISNGKTK